MVFVRLLPKWVFERVGKWSSVHQTSLNWLLIGQKWITWHKYWPLIGPSPFSHLNSLPAPNCRVQNLIQSMSGWVILRMTEELPSSEPDIQTSCHHTRVDISQSEALVRLNWPIRGSELSVSWIMLKWFSVIPENQVLATSPQRTQVIMWFRHVSDHKKKIRIQGILYSETQRTINAFAAPDPINLR